MNPFLIEDELKMKSHIFHISIQAPVFIILILFIILLKLPTPKQGFAP